MATRVLQQIIESVPTSDGAGVKLRRSLGSRRDLRWDPFLMLDEFSSDNPNDYIAGFPPHPHRGFETATYLLEGHMLHQDHLGHRGDLNTGGVQWMTAGRGIVHSEMPQQTQGRLHGFQLWINLPAREKMKPASYRDILPAEIPLVPMAKGGQVKVIAGTLILDKKPTPGPILGLTTDPLYLDIQLPAGGNFSHPIDNDYNAFIYPYAGEIAIGPGNERRRVQAHNVGLLSPGDLIDVGAEGDARFLLLAGRPLKEPIVQHGPFVMNTREEIEQALRDFESGELTQVV